MQMISDKASGQTTNGHVVAPDIGIVGFGVYFSVKQNNWDSFLKNGLNDFGKRLTLVRRNNEQVNSLVHQRLHLIDLPVGAVAGIFVEERVGWMKRKFPLHVVEHSLSPLIGTGALRKANPVCFALIWGWLTGRKEGADNKQTIKANRFKHDYGKIKNKADGVKSVLVKVKLELIE